MKIIATGFGDSQVLQTVPTEDRPPGSGEVAIQVRAAGVNHRDHKVYEDPDYAARRGQDATSFPLDLGVVAAGVVTAVGKDAFGPAGPIQVGDEVIAYRISGAYADAIVVSATAVVPKPTGLSWAQAASMMLVGTTAAHALAAVRARPGQTLLVHAAAGRVGLSVVQLARLDGIRVIGTASRKDFAALRRYDAIPVTYGDGLTERIAEAVPDGIDAALDLIGTDEAIDASLAVVADRSRIATVVAFDRARETGIQALGGSEGQDEWGIAVRDNARLRLIALSQAGAWDNLVSDSFPLREAAAAHQLLAQGHAAGSVVLVVQDL
ncbi:MAG: zinc-binding dehydrogenase [Actinomycetota bacterium]|nr:zinc-binding dehydrogenase [Actinomycetota bacterium]